MEYGPVPAQQVRDWINEGRLNRASRIQVEGGAEWQRLGELAEFSVALADAEPPAAPFTAAAAPPPPGGEPAHAPASGFAISSLVLGILGLVTCGITALPGLILGIVGLNKINKSQGRLSGSGLAIAGICVSGAFLLLVPVGAGLLLPALAKEKAKAQGAACMNNLRQISLGLLMYAGDNNETFPRADSWCDAIKKYVGSEIPFHCAMEPDQRSSYALNTKVAGKKTSDLRDPARTVLTFGCAGGWNKAGGQELASPHKHSQGFVMVGFADGHVQILPRDQLASLKWEP